MSKSKLRRKLLKDRNNGMKVRDNMYRSELRPRDVEPIDLSEMTNEDHTGRRLAYGFRLLSGRES